MFESDEGLFCITDEIQYDSWMLIIGYSSALYYNALHFNVLAPPKQIE